MQVDSIKPTLKAPGIKRLKLKYDEPLSNFAFKFNLRRYSAAAGALLAMAAFFVMPWPQSGAGAYTRPPFAQPAQPEPFLTQHTPSVPPDTL